MITVRQVPAAAQFVPTDPATGLFVPALIRANSNLYIRVLSARFFTGVAPASWVLRVNDPVNAGNTNLIATGTSAEFDIKEIDLPVENDGTVWPLTLATTGLTVAAFWSIHYSIVQLECGN